MSSTLMRMAVLRGPRPPAGDRPNRAKSLALAELARAQRGGLHGGLHGRAEAERLEPGEPGERGSARGADLLAQLGRCPLAFERELGGAKYRLKSQLVGGRARQAHALARGAERFEQQEDVGGPAAREPGDGVELRLALRDPHAADAGEELLCQSDLRRSRGG